MKNALKKRDQNPNQRQKIKRRKVRNLNLSLSLNQNLAKSQNPSQKRKINIKILLKKSPKFSKKTLRVLKVEVLWVKVVRIPLQAHQQVPNRKKIKRVNQKAKKEMVDLKKLQKKVPVKKRKKRKMDQAAVVHQQATLNQKVRKKMQKLKSRKVRLLHHQVALDQAVKIKAKRKNQHKKRNLRGLGVQKRVDLQIRRKTKVQILQVQVEPHQALMVSVHHLLQVLPAPLKKKSVVIGNKSIYLVSVAVSKKMTTMMTSFF